MIEIIQGKTTVAEASRIYDLTPSEVEGWVDDARKLREAYTQNLLSRYTLDLPSFEDEAK